MGYRIDVRPAATRQLRKLPRPAQRRIQSAIDGLILNPRPVGSKKLKGRQPAYRIRVGDYRVIYEIHDDVLTVLVVRVASRNVVYQH